MNSQVHPNNVQNNQMNNNDELEQLNYQQNQQVIPQIEQIQQIVPNQIVQNQDQEPQLQGQLQNYLNEQRTNLKLFLKFLVFQFIYYSSEFAIFSYCYSISKDQLNILQSMFIVIMVLDIVTLIEKIIIFKFALVYYHYTNEGLLPFQILIGTSYDINYIEQETKLRNNPLIVFSQIRKLFEFGQYLYSSITYYQNVVTIQGESQFIYIIMIIYFIIRSFILVLDILDLIKSQESLFQREAITYQNLHQDKTIITIFTAINLTEIIYLIAILSRKQTQCQGFDNFFYISLSVNLVMLIRRIQVILTINSQIQQNIQVPIENTLNNLAVFIRTKKISLKEILLNILLILYIFNFIICCITISQNLDSQCKLGDSDFNLEWSYAIYLLIFRGLTLGILTIISIIAILLLIVIQIAQNYESQQSKKFNNHVILSQNFNLKKKNKIFALKQDAVNGRLNDENLCIICLQEFVNGEQYVRLNCNIDHIYHKGCIFDWLIKRPSCPKCRVQI